MNAKTKGPFGTTASSLLLQLSKALSCERLDSETKTKKKGRKKARLFAPDFVFTPFPMLILSLSGGGDTDGLPGQEQELSLSWRVQFLLCTVPGRGRQSHQKLPELPQGSGMTDGAAEAEIKDLFTPEQLKHIKGR